MHTVEDPRIAVLNEAIVLDHVRTKLLETRGQRFVIRRKDTGVFYQSIGPAGQRWTGSPENAQPFEFITVATATILFHIDESPDLFEIVPVEG